MFLFSSCNSFLTLMRMRSWDTIEVSLSQWRVCLYPGIPDSLESILFAQTHQCFYCVRHQQPTLHLFTALTALNRSSLRWGGPLESWQHLSRMRSLHGKTLPDVCQERKVVIRNHQECSIKPIIVTEEHQLGKQSRGVERTQNLESKNRDLKPSSSSPTSNILNICWALSKHITCIISLNLHNYTWDGFYCIITLVF